MADTPALLVHNGEGAREFLMLGEGITDEAHESLWKRLWGNRDGQRFLEVHLELAAKREDPQRTWNSGSTAERNERAEETTRRLEAELTQLVEAE